MMKSERKHLILVPFIAAQCVVVCTVGSELCPVLSSPLSEAEMQLCCSLGRDQSVFSSSGSPHAFLLPVFCPGSKSDLTKITQT